MGSAEDIFRDVKVPDASRPDATGGDYGPTRIEFADQLAHGMVILSPSKCPGAESCDLASLVHRPGRYHEFQVHSTRNVEYPPGSGINATVVIYTDEAGEQQALGPLIGFGPVRIKLRLDEINTAELDEVARRMSRGD